MSGGRGATTKAARVSYSGQGLSQDAVDQAWRIYQLCLQAEKGLIPKDIYVAALRRFYGLDDTPSPASSQAAAQPAPNVEALAAPVDAAPACTVLEEVDNLTARMRGTIGEHEVLSWAKAGNAGWIWSSKGLFGGTLEIQENPSLETRI